MINNAPYAHEPALVGRDELVTAIISSLDTERLITLTGPGGVGKTSLARHLATSPHSLQVFADGVDWVDLAAVSDPTAVPQAVANACGVAEQRDRPWVESVSVALRSRQGLLVLDNCEHLLTVALLLISLGNLTLDEGDLDAAREGAGLAHSLDLKAMEALCLAHLGRTVTAQGEYAEGARCLREALRMCLPLARSMRTAGAIHYCAALVFQLGYPAQATMLFVAGLRAVKAEGEDFSYLGFGDSTELLACFRAAQAALDPAEHALAVADAQALSLEAAAELALSAVFLPAPAPCRAVGAADLPAWPAAGRPRRTRADGCGLGLCQDQRSAAAAVAGRIGHQGRAGGGALAGGVGEADQAQFS